MTIILKDEILLRVCLLINTKFVQNEGYKFTSLTISAFCARISFIISTLLHKFITNLVRSFINVSGLRTWANGDLQLLLYSLLKVFS